MDISSVDYSNLSSIASRARVARRISGKQAPSQSGQEVAPVTRRLDESTSKKMDAFAKVQQVFMFARRLGEEIQQRGILEPIV